MAAIKIPSGTLLGAPQPCGRELLNRTIRELTAQQPPFTGYLALTSEQALHLLFFFQGAPYAAGVSVGGKPSSLGILDFLREAGKLAAGGALLSIHQSDPVLLKCLLVFIQDELTAKAPTTLINLESILEQLRREAADALIILEKQGLYNLFFFKDGTKGKAYYADQAFAVEEALPIDEQLLLYAFQGGTVPVNAMMYRTIATAAAPDAGAATAEEMARCLGLSGDETGVFQRLDPLPHGGEVAHQLELLVLEGTRKGETLMAQLPCVVGRRDADLVIPDPMISKSHISFQLQQGLLQLVDLGSTNGTWLNGQRIQQHEIVAGDLIAIGGTQLKLLRWGTPNQLLPG